MKELGEDVSGVLGQKDSLRRQEEAGGASEMINAKLEDEVKQGLIILIGLSSNPQLPITPTANRL